MSWLSKLMNGEILEPKQINQPVNKVAWLEEEMISKKADFQDERMKQIKNLSTDALAHVYTEAKMQKDGKKIPEFYMDEYFKNRELVLKDRAKIEEDLLALIPKHSQEEKFKKWASNDDVMHIDSKDRPCPGCGAYWGNPNKELDFPNRYKVDDWMRCYNPKCKVGYYQPSTGEIELRLTEQQERALDERLEREWKTSMLIDVDNIWTIKKIDGEEVIVRSHPKKKNIERESDLEIEDIKVRETLFAKDQYVKNVATQEVGKIIKFDNPDFGPAYINVSFLKSPILWVKSDMIKPLTADEVVVHKAAEEKQILSDPLYNYMFEKHHISLKEAGLKQLKLELTSALKKEFSTFAEIPADTLDKVANDFVQDPDYVQLYDKSVAGHSQKTDDLKAQIPIVDRVQDDGNYTPNTKDFGEVFHQDKLAPATAALKDFKVGDKVSYNSHEGIKQPGQGTIVDLWETPEDKITRATVRGDGKTVCIGDEDLDVKATLIAELKKDAYITHVPGHKNSKGELAEYVIKSHDTGKIISSHKTKAEAESHLEDIRKFKHMSMQKKKADEKDQAVANFVKQHGLASGGNWSAMLMSAIKNGLPEVYSKLDNNKKYTFVELFELIKASIPSENQLIALLKKDAKIKELKCPKCGSPYVYPEPGVDDVVKWTCDDCGAVEESPTINDAELVLSSQKKQAATEAANEFISKKIKKLMDEGKEQDQAIAIAYSMARAEGYDVPEKKAAIQYYDDITKTVRKPEEIGINPNDDKAPDVVTWHDGKKYTKQKVESTAELKLSAKDLVPYESKLPNAPYTEEEFISLQVPNVSSENIARWLNKFKTELSKKDEQIKIYPDNPIMYDKLTAQQKDALQQVFMQFIYAMENFYGVDFNIMPTDISLKKDNAGLVVVEFPMKMEIRTKILENLTQNMPQIPLMN